MRKTIILSESEIRSIISRVHRMGGLINEGLQETKSKYIGKLPEEKQALYDEIVKIITEGETYDLQSLGALLPFVVISGGEFDKYMSLETSPGAVDARTIFSSTLGMKPDDLFNAEGFLNSVGPWVSTSKIQEFLKDIPDDGDSFLKISDREAPSPGAGPSATKSVKSPSASGIEALRFTTKSGRVTTVTAVYNPYHIAKIIVYELKKNEIVPPELPLAALAKEILGIDAETK